MVSTNKIVITIIILLFLSVLLSGYIEEKNAAPAPGLDEYSGLSSMQWGEEYISEIITTNAVQRKRVNTSHANLTLMSGKGHNPEIKIISLSSIYKHDNSDDRENGTVYKKMNRNKYEPDKRYYAAYNLSIKNNGSSPLYFKLNELRLREGDNTFNVTPLEPYKSDGLEVLRDLEYENKLQDTTLLPGQSLSGTVAFRVKSLYDESFLLTYNATPVTSATFEKSIEALRTAEDFNYSIALGKLPYIHNTNITRLSYVPIFNDSFETQANWVNRRIFETFKNSDIERMQNSPQYIGVEMVYALRVIPDRNITMFPMRSVYQWYLFNWDEIPGNDSGILLDYLDQKYGIDGVKTARIEKSDDGNTIRLYVEDIDLSLTLNNEKTRVSFGMDDGKNYEFIARTENGRLNIYGFRFENPRLLVIDDNGEELINIPDIAGLAVMSNYTYKYRSGWKLDFPGMNISNASVVHISFEAGYYGGIARITRCNMDVILNEALNVIAVRYDTFNPIS